MTLGVWNLALGELTCRCEGHSLGILGAWLSTDALKAVSGGFDSVIRQWDLSTGSLKAECTRVMAGHSGPVVSIEASAHSILSTSFDGTLRVWDWSGRQVSCIEAHDGHSSGLVILADGDHALTGGDDSLLKRWDLATGDCISAGHGHNGSVWCVTVPRAPGVESSATSPHVCLSAATDGSLVLWDLRAAESPTLLVENAHEDAVAGLQADGLQCVSGGFDSQVKIWDLRQGLALRATMAAPPNAKCTRVAYDDTRVVTGSLTGSFVVFDMI